MRDKYHEITAVSEEGHAEAKSVATAGDPAAQHSDVPPTTASDVPFDEAAEAHEHGAL
ncbi:hypothetical protein [Lacisediminihabitans changchengi]|uniref:Uncharacterized protein n=1 Tax=Lacisediminihabitans changchengi TaxID=2787634 RepID=A0A934SUH8_9MICO|nr:hypothetical protein [Lacisediminihabitans changchengi]MBK4348284.1 hypothetical protein [Lacisediminihabitans changchengi]